MSANIPSSGGQGGHKIDRSSIFYFNLGAEEREREREREEG